MQNINDIISWLEFVEKKAADTYKITAQLFKDDERKNKFFTGLAKDEDEHYAILQEAKTILKDDIFECNDILLGEKTKNEIEKKFTEFYNYINGKNISFDKVLTYMVELEDSEWSTYFLYVLQHLKRFDNKYDLYETEFKSHIFHITEYVKSIPEGKTAQDILVKLNERFRDTILYVDPCAITRFFIEKVIGKHYNVITTPTYEKGLDLASGTMFNLFIFVDRIDEISGIDFYHKISNIFPGAVDKTLLVTTDASTPIEFKKAGAKIISKPFASDTITDIIERILKINRTTL